MHTNLTMPSMSFCMHYRETRSNIISVNGVRKGGFIGPRPIFTDNIMHEIIKILMPQELCVQKVSVAISAPNK